MSREQGFVIEKSRRETLEKESEAAIEDGGQGFEHKKSLKKLGAAACSHDETRQPRRAF